VKKTKELRATALRVQLHSLIILVWVFLPSLTAFAQDEDPIAPGAAVERIATGYTFLEGPSADTYGNIYFTDIPTERILRWTPDDGVTIYRENTNQANGLSFDLDGRLLICEMKSRRITAIELDGNGTNIADRFDGQRFNSPNDVWVDQNGGIYFTDPRYGATDDTELDGNHVFYITPDTNIILQVADNLVRPNGLVGTPDGRRLYIADHGGGQTFVYDIEPTGRLSNQRLFVPQGADGITLDSKGNVYLTGDDVTIYNPSGILVGSIAVPEPPANLAFGGIDGTTLFITARSSLYSIKMMVTGQ